MDGPNIPFGCSYLLPPLDGSSLPDAELPSMPLGFARDNIPKGARVAALSKSGDELPMSMMEADADCSSGGRLAIEGSKGPAGIPEALRSLVCNALSLSGVCGSLGLIEPGDKSLVDIFN